MSDEIHRMRQRQRSERSRRKNRELGRPEIRIIHAAYFEAVQAAIAASVERGGPDPSSSLRDIEHAVIGNVIDMGYDADEVENRHRSMVTQAGHAARPPVRDFPIPVPPRSPTEDLMVGTFLDLSALKKAVEAERAEREIMVSLVMSPAWTQASTALSFLSAGTIGFPTSLQMGRYFGVDECLLQHGIHGWAVASVRGVADTDRRSDWADFDRERFLRELLAEIGMGDSEIAYGMFDRIVPHAEAVSDVEECRHELPPAPTVHGVIEDHEHHEDNEQTEGTPPFPLTTIPNR